MVERTKKRRRNDVFRRQPQPASHGKIIRLCAALLLVLFMMYRARDPAVWAWMFPPGQANVPAAGNQVPQATGDSHPLPTDLYDAVEDDTLFRAGDREPLVAALDWLQETPQAEIAASSAGQVAYAQLYQQPEHYRGEIVTVRGLLRQVSTKNRPITSVEPAAVVERDPSNENSTDGTGVPAEVTPEDDEVAQAQAPEDRNTWYEFFLQPDDHPSEPIIIYGLNLPQGFPEAGRMRQPAQVTGVFYKRLVYSAASEPAIAPMILAKEIELTGPAQEAVAEDNTIELIVISGCIALLVATIFMFVFRRMTSDRRSAERSANAILAKLESKRGE